MKLFTKTLTILLFFAIGFEAISQELLKHEKSIHTNSEDKVYVNLEVPIYLSISMKADGSNGTILKGEDPKYSYPMYFDAEGYNTFRSPSKVDPETGKLVYPKQDVVFEVYADGSAPNVNIVYSGENKITMEGTSIIDGNKVSFEAKDNLSGVNGIYYSQDKGAYKKYSSPITLSEDKIYDISYYTVDEVGNVSEPKQASVRPDLKAPVTKMTLDGDQFETTLSPRSTILLEASDDISGLSKIFWAIDDGRTYTYGQPIKLSTLDEGAHTLTYFSVDKVSNDEDKKTYSFFLDKSAPRVISEAVGNTFIANGREYFSGRTKVKLVSMDNKAGVQEVLYSVNGGEYILYEEPFLLKEAGNLDINVLSIDKVNNKQTIEEITDNDKTRAYVDLSGPNLTNSFIGPSFVIRDTVYINSISKIVLKGTDSESGFKEIDFQLNGGTLETYTDPFSIDSDGFYEITFNGYDNLQNSNTSSFRVHVDNKGPDVYNRFSIESNKFKTIDGEKIPVYPSHVVLFLSSTDKYSGLDKITYRINGSADLAYKGLIENFKKETAYTVIADVVDKLGNENSMEIKFYIE